MKNFVIFGTGRTGSTLLVSLLNSQPFICCDGEIFHRNRWGRWRYPFYMIFRRYSLPYICWRKTLAHYHRGARAYGFKFLVRQLSNPDHHLVRLHSSDWRILYLRRLSLFDTAISISVAQVTRRWHTGEKNRPEPDIEPFPLDPAQFLETLSERDKYARLACDAATAVPHLEIVYENDLQLPDKWDTTITRICDYLDMDSWTAQVTTPLNKPWSHPYRELVSNYSELFELARQKQNNA